MLTTVHIIPILERQKGVPNVVAPIDWANQGVGSVPARYLLKRGGKYQDQSIFLVLAHSFYHMKEKLPHEEGGTHTITKCLKCSLHPTF